MQLGQAIAQIRKERGLTQEAQKKKSELVAGILREERLQYFDFRADGFGESRAFYFRDPDGIILEMMQPL